MVTIYFLRHGQTDYNATQARIGGRSNHLTLNKIGLMQADRAAEWFGESGNRFDAIFCSSAVRARSTLSPILAKLDFDTDNVTYSDNLNEVNQGDWEGQPRKEILTEEMMTRMANESPYFHAPNGESHKEAEKRMYGFIQKNIIDKYESGHFLVVGHGLSFKCLLQGIMGLDPKMTYKMGVGNVSLSRLRYDKKRGWHLDFLNRQII